MEQKKEFILLGTIAVDRNEIILVQTNERTLVNNDYVQRNYGIFQIFVHIKSNPQHPIKVEVLKNNEENMSDIKNFLDDVFQDEIYSVREEIVKKMLNPRKFETINE